MIVRAFKRNDGTIDGHGYWWEDSRYFRTWNRLLGSCRVVRVSGFIMRRARLARNYESRNTASLPLLFEIAAVRSRLNANRALSARRGNGRIVGEIGPTVQRDFRIPKRWKAFLRRCVLRWTDDALLVSLRWISRIRSQLRNIARVIYQITASDRCIGNTAIPQVNIWPLNIETVMILVEWYAWVYFNARSQQVSSKSIVYFILTKKTYKGSVNYRFGWNLA